jgi:hypothetical protein
MHQKLSIVVLLFVLLLSLTLVQAEAASSCGTHLVQRGENLFRISLRYGVNMYAVGAANNIPDVTRIYAGQVLTIPCGGTYNPNQPTYPPQNPPPYQPPHQPPYQPPYAPPVYQPPQYHAPTSYYVDCYGFRASSPDAFGNGTMTFYWDAPRDYQRVARYQVRIYNSLGREVARYETLGLYTNLQGNVGLGALGPGINFTYYVIGITGDNRICQTATRRVRREWNGTADPLF